MADTREVPREPTEAMLQVAYDLVPIAPGTETWRIGRYPHPDELWRAMWDAAPVPAPPAERYSPKMGRGCDGRYVEMVPDPRGEWVRYHAPAAEPVAQQPEAPRELTADEDRMLHRALMRSVKVKREAAAPAEAPQGDDLVARLHSDADAWERHQDDYGDVVRIEREAAARIESDVARIRELEAEVERERETSEAAEEFSDLNDRLSKLLTGVANALKGEPPPLTLHSWHDLPELAAASRERERLYAELIYAVASKFPGETRHETALRYIRNAERGGDQCAKATVSPDSAASP